MQPCQEDNRSFFEKLQNAKGLDLRDNRGKRHELAIVLTGVMMALMCNRDGCLSSVHRHLKNHYHKLMRALKLEVESAISRAQLPRVLEKVSVEVFDRLLFESYGIRLNSEQRTWFAIDGKELRGSIQSGDKRGEAVVAAVRHETLDVQSQTYYSGNKESEVVAVRKLIKENGLSAQKISLHALHCKPKTLAPIAEAGGIYLVGLKKNQKEMFQDVERESGRLEVKYKRETIEKGHGRIEERKYQVYDIADIYQDQRWAMCQISTVVKVERKRFLIKSGKQSVETSYYISNQSANYAELCDAVRNHWAVETNNHIRDVTLKEDKLRTKKRRLTACWQGLEP